MANYTNYPRAVLEGCENELREQGLPDWFISRFRVAEEGKPEQWGRAEVNAYEWPQPITKNADGYMVPVDISSMLTAEQWQTLELAAVARAWLEIFGERTPWELALACEFSRLDAVREATSWKASRAGRKSRENLRKALSPRDTRIVFRAVALIDNGTPEHKLTSTLETEFALTNRQLRNILQRAGILKAKKK